jgi:hypothetical protein
MYEDVLLWSTNVEAQGQCMSHRQLAQGPSCLIEAHEFRTTVESIGSCRRTGRDAIIYYPEATLIITHDILNVDEACTGILPYSAVLHGSIWPWLFIIECSADDDVVGRLARVARICEIEIVVCVNGETCGWFLAVVDCLQGWSDNCKILGVCPMIVARSEGSKAAWWSVKVRVCDTVSD